jgi:hypothetical protein
LPRERHPRVRPFISCLRLRPVRGNQPTGGCPRFTPTRESWLRGNVHGLGWQEERLGGESRETITAAPEQWWSTAIKQNTAKKRLGPRLNSTSRQGQSAETNPHKAGHPVAAAGDYWKGERDGLESRPPKTTTGRPLHSAHDQHTDGVGVARTGVPAMDTHNGVPCLQNANLHAPSSERERAPEAPRRKPDSPAFPAPWPSRSDCPHPEPNCPPPPATAHQEFHNGATKKIFQRSSTTAPSLWGR